MLSLRDSVPGLIRLAGADPRDNFTLAQPAPLNYSAQLHGDALRGARIGVLRRGFTRDFNLTREHFGFSLEQPPNEVLVAFNHSLSTIEQLGATGM
jgi:Asp-tRNA(Asn)/Glu-tRNA(Gln) amidotransferase A subunit family amidase